jgi:hypothetical protein
MSTELDLKNKLKLWALAILQERIATAQAAMQQAQESANAEEKSSVGDKYETARAMGHLQKDMHARQLAEALKDLAALQTVRTDVLYERAGPGAFVQAEGVAFFISAGLGRQMPEGREVIFLSPKAPMAGVLEGKKVGEEVLFQQRVIVIRRIY